MFTIRKPSRRVATVAVATVALVAGGLAVADTASSHAVPSTSARVVTRNPARLPSMTDINWASHSGNGGYDRVVWNFSGSAPGYDVRYVTTPTYCGSGAPVVASTAPVASAYVPAVFACGVNTCSSETE